MLEESSCSVNEMLEKYSSILGHVVYHYHSLYLLARKRGGKLPPILKCVSNFVRKFDSLYKSSHEFFVDVLTTPNGSPIFLKLFFPEKTTIVYPDVVDVIATSVGNSMSESVVLEHLARVQTLKSTWMLINPYPKKAPNSFWNDGTIIKIL